MTFYCIFPLMWNHVESISHLEPSFQVWNWFQNRRYAIRAKLSKAPGKLNVSPVPRDDSTPVRNVPQSIAAPIPAPSGGMHPSLCSSFKGLLCLFQNFGLYLLYAVLLELSLVARLKLLRAQICLINQCVTLYLFECLTFLNLLVLSIWFVCNHCIAQCRPISASTCMMCLAIAFCCYFLF